MTYLKLIIRILTLLLHLLGRADRVVSFLLRKKARPLIVAHRGAARYFPENTFLSFNKAVEMGADFLEMDVQMSKDGHLVVIHDVTVNRTTNGKGRIFELTFEQLSKLNAGNKGSLPQPETRLPSFSEVLDQYAGKIGLLIELKNPELYSGIEKKMAEELKSRGLDQLNKGEIIIQSFNKNTLLNFHQELPTIPLGLLIKRFQGASNEGELNKLSKYVNYLNPKYSILTKSLVRRAHKHGLKVIVWTIKDKTMAEKAFKLNVDGIVTDYLELPSKSNIKQASN
ncbi:glycerophosphodiester phosphodiesterase [Mesobacillus harenae]|uniref:glycerophosphodiester phosphodiesterase n=1 Tax=Mesobacillus harenae TaxID=2213203 RepID=UPI00158111CA|nr:glycerophosphodiester phosphodiesterase family protein [Mesobacillus harenae]